VCFSIIFWNVTPCSSETARRFGGKTQAQVAACFCWFLASLTLRPWIRRRCSSETSAMCMPVHPRSSYSSSTICARHLVRSTTSNLMIARLETGRDVRLINATVIWRPLQIKPSVPIYVSIYLWLCSPLLVLAAFSVSWSYTQSVGLLGRGISPSQGRYLHTEQHKHKTSVHRYSCLDWGWNPRS
jgi:hypothetical protein